MHPLKHCFAVSRRAVSFLSALWIIAFTFASLAKAQTVPVNSIPLSSIPQNARIMIWGDSVTETGNAYYPRYVEGYLVACTGRSDIKVFTTGHSGATLGETLSRESDLGAFNPTLVTVFYGFNDDSFGESTSSWDSTMQSVIAMYKSKDIDPVISSPGWTDGNNGNPSVLTAYQQTLASYNTISYNDTSSASVNYSDICDQTRNSLNAALAVYGSSYTIGEHYTPNGAITVAYEDVKSLGATGTIGNVNVDMTAGTATASTGHTVVSYSNGTVVLDSTTYPFCYNYDPNEYQGTTGIASMLPYVPFSSDLNRFILTVTNLGAASANVTWGNQTMNFTSAQLAAGVNLTAFYTATPFDTTFAQVMSAVLNKEQFENFEVKGTANYFANDNGGNIDHNMVTVQAQLDAGMRALIVPVRHSIIIVPTGASTSVAPVIDGTMMAYPYLGQYFTFQVSALNNPTSFSATGLPPGLTMSSSGYISGTPTATGITAATVTATNSYGTSAAAKLTFNVQTPIPSPPSITSSLTATATVGQPFSYQITATNNPTNYFVVVPSNVGTVGTTTPPYTYPSLPPGLTYNTTTGVFSGTPTVAGTYNVVIAAMNAGGVTAVSDTNPLVLTINPSSGNAPPAPTNLTAASGNNQVNLSWSASAGATSYNVYRGTSTGAEGATPIATGLTAKSYTDSSVSSGTTYFYQIRAVNSGGTSGASNEASATPVLGLPSAPTNLAAVPGNAQISLSWTAGAGAASYNIYRGTLPGQENPTPIATNITTASYTDTTVSNGPTFYYKVAGVNASGTSGFSNEASAAPSASYSNATTYYQDGFSRTGDLTGTAPDVKDTGGAVWTTTNGSGYYPVSNGTVSIAPSAPSFTAEYLPVNGSTGITLDGTRDFNLSVAVTAATTGGIGISLNTAAPANLFSNELAGLYTTSTYAGGYAFNRGAVMTSSAPGITGQTIISLAYSASAQTLTYTVGATKLYTQTGVTAAQIASIRYVALGDDGYGNNAATPAPTFDNFSLSVGSTTSGAPLAPTNVVATASVGQVSLTWTGSSDATSYSIYRGTTSGGEGMTALATGITTTSYVDTSVSGGTTYYYEVVAVNSSGSSGFSTETNVTSTPASPATDTPTLPQWALILFGLALFGFAALRISRNRVEGA